MKKIALSAAVLSLTMMGCSDMGLDNSVSSTTGGVQKESNVENIQFLSKSSDNGGFIAGGGFTTNSIVLNSGEYRASFGSYKMKTDNGSYFYGPFYTGGSLQIFNVKNNTVSMDQVADMISITVCGKNCHLNGDDVKCDAVWETGKVTQFNVNKMDNQCGVLDGPFIGTVSTSAIIVNNGTDHSHTLMATTTVGFTEEVAAKMYKKYIQDKYGN